MYVSVVDFEHKNKKDMKKILFKLISL